MFSIQVRNGKTSSMGNSKSPFINYKCRFSSSESANEQKASMLVVCAFVNIYSDESRIFA